MNRQSGPKLRAAYPDPFSLEQDRAFLLAILDDIQGQADLAEHDLAHILRRHPLPNGRTLSKSLLLSAYRQLCAQSGRTPDPKVVRRLRVKPTRTISGVAPVSVLTKPYPCPGECIFCPNADQMPKSYLPDEPGAMRAASHSFDPFSQTAGRVSVMSQLGHQVDKVELLILGGTWSCYPEDYQEWFVRRCLDALNGRAASTLEEAQRINEGARHRNVGLAIETRPDCVTQKEVRRLRHLGVTRVQLGVQSLSDNILSLNRRGHTVADTRSAMRLLRLAGFKTVLHWMPNLLGATPETDQADFRMLWDDPAIRPDGLKIYPTALLTGTELHAHWQRGAYEPYDEDTLVSMLAYCKTLIPPYCRVNRLMRDIPAPNIVAGVKRSNLRQVVRAHMARSGLKCRCIRCREVRDRAIDVGALRLDRTDYATDATNEVFLSALTPEGRVAGFARLSLPQAAPPISDVEGCAVLRELHVYGPALALSAQQPGAAQHLGLGTRLLTQAQQVARHEGYDRFAVIAATGTRPYYRERGFSASPLYMFRPL